MKDASIYSDEAMLLRWGENNSNGRTVTLQLTEEGDHPFKGFPSGAKNGQRFMVVVVPITDEGKPQKGGELAKRAGILCSDQMFAAWVRQGSALNPADYIRMRCGVNSRAELDHSDAAAQNFRAIVADYHTWRDGPSVGAA